MHIQLLSICISLAHRGMLIVEGGKKALKNAPKSVLNVTLFKTKVAVTHLTLDLILIEEHVRLLRELLKNVPGIQIHLMH